MPEISTLDLYLAPSALATVLVPCLLVAYLWIMRPRITVPAPWMDGQASTTAVQSFAASTSRYAGGLLMLAGLCLLLAGIARPQAVLMLPSRMDTVMLAVDTSGSMRATDVKPSALKPPGRAAPFYRSAAASG